LARLTPANGVVLDAIMTTNRERQELALRRKIEGRYDWLERTHELIVRHIRADRQRMLDLGFSKQEVDDVCARAAAKAREEYPDNQGEFIRDLLGY
jgi:hypothetical protein